MTQWSRAWTTMFVLTAVLPVLPSPISAQGTGQGFLFKQPTLQVGLDFGYMMPASGAVLDRAIDDFTLDERDFGASTLGLELAVRGSERLDFALDVRYSRNKTGSESRPYLGDDGLPILQVTTFTRVPVTGSAKYYLRDRGRSVSQFAWIPEKWTPYVGAGGGWYWYQLKQAGEFVEEPSLDIIPLVLKSSGFEGVVHVFAGVDVSISSRFLWTLEGRYTFARTDTGIAFDFADLDLGGLQATIGISARF